MSQVSGIPLYRFLEFWTTFGGIRYPPYRKSASATRTGTLVTGTLNSGAFWHRYPTLYCASRANTFTTPKLLYISQLSTFVKTYYKACIYFYKRRKRFVDSFISFCLQGRQRSRASYFHLNIDFEGGLSFLEWKSEARDLGRAWKRKLVKLFATVFSFYIHIYVLYLYKKWNILLVS